ncbi:MAG TPA: pyridoxal-dependent decarboxylase [Rhodanobacteraceae bacterium]|nr:pyridoxal-dependent decarboxylase [Rhodanobacteraceae bacterium]
MATPLPFVADSALSGSDAHAYLAPLFLGSAGENSGAFERALLGLVREHMRWRRGFHPHDPPSITSADQSEPSFSAAMQRMEQGLRDLSARLQRSAPMFSPRYVGHMASDLLLPGLLAHLATTLYNPNNVSAETAPVTADMEIEVGQQLARMCGFNTDPALGRAAYGHLTSGGTVANYEALWLHRAVRFWPLALADALGGDEQIAAMLARATGDGPRNSWRLVNLELNVILDLHAQVEAALDKRDDGGKLRSQLAAARFERLGTADFLTRHQLAPPVVICPRTAHYSWPKAMQLLGLGDAQLWYADVDAHMRISPESVGLLLERAFRDEIPVLAVVGVLGTTEFGTIDPVHELVALRDACAPRGQAFAVHIDAAWGGYLATLFRHADGKVVPHAQVRARFNYFPSARVYRAFTSLGRADSVTVDPHKLGYLPYGAGGFVGRDRRMTQFVGQRPVYIYDHADGHADAGRLAQLGDYILEGSKAGAAAAAVYVSHQVLPLDAEHFGRVCGHTIRATEYLFERLREMAKRLSASCKIVMPVEPDTNLVCIAVNPAGNNSLARMNRFGRALFRHFALDPANPQACEFIGSHTSLLRKNLSPIAARKLARRLGFDPNSFVAAVHDPNDEADHVFLLRHTLMNPWLSDDSEGDGFVDRYCEFLERSIAQTLETDW